MMMKIANGISVLELEMNAGRPLVIHPTLLWDEENVVLIDTGMPGQFAALREAVEKEGVVFDRLNRIILTHQDIDHIGGLTAILRASDHKIDVLAHKDDQPYIEGKKPLIKMTPERMAQLLQAVPESDRKMTHKVDQTLVDGDVLPFAGGIMVIATPGHTPGHISLYHQPSKTLIAGDAMIVADGQLSGPNPAVTPDMDTALASLRKLAAYDIETVVCYHGGIYRGDVNARIQALAEGR